MNKYISMLMLAPAIYVGLNSSSQAQVFVTVPGGTANPSTVRPYEVNTTSGDGSASISLVNGGSMSATIPVFSPPSSATAELIYGFKIAYTGPAPAPSNLHIDISGAATTEGVVGSATVDAQALFGALGEQFVAGDPNPYAALLNTPQLMIDNSSVGSNRRIDSFDPTYSVFTGQSYGIELSIQLNSLGSPGTAFVDPQINLDVSDPQDYRLILSPGISLGSSAAVPDSGATLGLLALSLTALTALTPFHRRFARQSSCV